MQLPVERQALLEFRRRHADLFEKSDRRLAIHLLVVLSLLVLSTAILVSVEWVPLRIPLACLNGLLMFSLINVTIHHHHTHHNAARGRAWTRTLDLLYRIMVPNSSKRLVRYRRAHLNHHRHPLEGTDVDHNFGVRHYVKATRTPIGRLLYFLDLTFIGSRVPAGQDQRYLSSVPTDEWNEADYAFVMEREKPRAVLTALWQWSGFFLALFIIPWLAWAWILPMLLVKNWSHFLGQFQHYGEKLIDTELPTWQRTRTFRVPSWLNYLVGGEISGHFVHHMYPGMPYYNVERARKRVLEDSRMAELFVHDLAA